MQLGKYGSVEKPMIDRDTLDFIQKGLKAVKKKKKGKEACVFLAKYMTRSKVTPLQESKTGHVYEKVRGVPSQHLVRARVPAPWDGVAAHVRFIKVSPSYLGSAKNQVEVGGTQQSRWHSQMVQPRGQLKQMPA